MSIKTKIITSVTTVLLTGAVLMPLVASAYTWSANLKLGSTGADVKELQIFLNKDAATQVAATSYGSPGNETTYFGPLTRAAVIKFQEKYIADILTPLGLTAGTGYFYSASRAKANALSAVVVTPPGTTPPVVVVPQGTGLTVTAASAQPTASLAPYNASRIPFTVVNFTASADGDVTVNSLVIERTGLAADAAISGIILLDENNLQLGLEKTLNSVHQVTLTEAFTVKAGQTRTLTIAGNRPATAGSHAGEIAYLSLVSVNTSAAVHGTLPITGTGQTINESLALGSITQARGPLDPGVAASKEVGTTGYTYSSIKITAGSAEKVRLLSIRWNQSGSAAKDDLANVKTYVDGVAYATVVSSDGKYYTSTFDSGIVIDKGFSKEISVKGDIASGSARTIIFDIYKTTDLYLKGETYGYGIAPAAGSSTGDGNFTASQPWYDAYAVTVSAGTLAVSKSTKVEAQNIGVNLADQPLGGFDIEAKGEPVSVAQMIFYVATTSGASVLTNVSLYDENGKVVSGPVDWAWSATSLMKLTFTDTVTFPTGKHTYTLKGKSDTTTTGGTYSVYTTPSASASAASNWTTVKGQNTGVTIYPTPYSAVYGSTMSPKAGALAVSASPYPLGQTVIAGVTQFTFANYILNAGASGEDVSLNSIKLNYTATSSTNAQKLTNCQLYDGAASITTGSNAKTPTDRSSSTALTFDSPLTITKGTSKTLALKCDIAGNAYAGHTYQWGYGYGTAGDTTINAYMSPMGKTSGQDIAETYPTTDNGSVMTVATAGSYTVVDDSSPGYSIVAAGTTGVTLAKFKFIASNEDIDIYKVDLFLTGVAATSSRDDLVNQTLTLYDADSPTTAIATAQFNQSAQLRFASSTVFAAGAFRIPSGSYKTMLVKGDISVINYSQGPLVRSGDLLRVGYLANNGGTDGNYGKGVSSGTTINDSTATAINTTGVRIMKAYPTVAKDAIPSNTLITQTGFKAYRFHVTANNGDVYLAKFSFQISSSTGGGVASSRTGRYGLYAYTDSAWSQLDSSYNSGSPGLLNDGYVVNGLGNTAASEASPGATSTTSWSDTAKNSCAGYVCKGVDANLTQVTGTNDALLKIYPYVSSATTTYKVPKGTTRYFELRMDVVNVESSTGAESFFVQMNGDAAFPTGGGGGDGAGYRSMERAGTRAGDLGIETEAASNFDFIWSPNSTSSTIGLGDTDFTNGYGVSGLPSTNLDAQTLTSVN